MRTTRLRNFYMREIKASVEPLIPSSKETWMILKPLHVLNTLKQMLRKTILIAEITLKYPKNYIKKLKFTQKRKPMF